jgi:D-alanyl-D-alanine carboxypeptidase/D-alanyl-D-alanine-endopeptidase (penicillin-binding protein 4)
MRRASSCLAGLAALTASLALASSAAAADPEAALRATLAEQMAAGPEAEGALVVDVADGRIVFEDRADAPRLTASLTKLFTTATALGELGQDTRLRTKVLGAGHLRKGTWHGDLVLRGAGDHTFGSRRFGELAYGGGGTVEELAAGVRRAGIRRVTGSILADASVFAGDRGEPFQLALCDEPLFGPGCPYGPPGHFERPIPSGLRTGVTFDRGVQSATNIEPQEDPVRFAAERLRDALAAAGVTVAGGAAAGLTPPGARPLASTASPTMATLAKLVNRPSDNFAADTLLQVIGARAGGEGTRERGAAVVEESMQRRFGIAPEVVSGSGETIEDRASPREVVRLLTGVRREPIARAFEHSLSIAGRSGTLRRLHDVPAQDRCLLKDGTRVDPVQANTTLNLAGICRSAGGRTFAFAVMMNGMPLEFVPPDRIESPAYALQDAFVNALAAYTG